MADRDVDLLLDLAGRGDRSFQKQGEPLKKLHQEVLNLWKEVEAQSETNPAMRMIAERLERICELLFPPFSMHVAPESEKAANEDKAA